MTFENRTDQPIGSTAPRGRRPFTANRNDSIGASIGDGMKTSARIAGATTIVGLLLNAGPWLMACFAGILLFARGCLSNLMLPPQPVAHVPHAQAAAAPLTYARPQYARAPIATKLPIRPPVDMRHQAEPELQRQANDAEVDHASGFETAGYAESFPNQMSMNYPPSISFGMPPAGNFPVTAFWGLGLNAPSNPMLDVVTTSPPVADSSTQTVSPLFSFQTGRKFAGTSQMPGEPSRRIMLSIAAIRDRGTNIAAKISTLEGASFTRTYTGLIEKEPWRLKLIPVRNPKSFGTFVTFMPWYSNSPTDITLEVAADGKSLVGTSVGSEQFELLPQFEISQEDTQADETADEIGSSLDDTRAGGTQWQLIERNSKPIREDDLQIWTFTQRSPGKGNFAWTKDSAILAQGTYAEGQVKGHIDITLASGAEPQLYLGLMDSTVGTDQAMRFCIPLAADQKRPARITEKYGNVFKLQRMMEGEVAP